MISFLGFEANRGSHYDVRQYSRIRMENGLKFMMSLSMSHHSSFNNNSIQQLQITYLINSECVRCDCELDTKMHGRKIERFLAADTNPRPDSIK